MRTIGEIRRLRLRQLLDDTGFSIAEVGRRLGRSSRDSTLGQILNGAPDSKTKKPRQMGDAQARLLEEKFQKPSGWFDWDPDFEATLAGNPPSTGERPPPPFGVGDLLERMGQLFASVPPAKREALARVLDGWVREGGADHYRDLAMTLLSNTEPGKRRLLA